MDANRGYSGYSMSKRAVAAYEDGEMPKSKWTKRAMLAAIESWADENGYPNLAEALSKCSKAQLWETLFTYSSWHHTSKYFNETDFYSLNEDAIAEFAEAGDPAAMLEQKLQKDSEREEHFQTLRQARGEDPQRLEELAAHEDYGVRSAVAANESAPPELLAQLARDENEHVLRGVAGNKTTPAHVLESLYENPNIPQFVETLARNPSTPESVLSQIAESPYVGAHLAVACNRSTPGAVLDKLVSNTPNTEALVAAYNNPNLLDATREKIWASNSLPLAREVIGSVAYERKPVPLEVQMRAVDLLLAHDNEYHDRLAALTARSTYPELIDQLADRYPRHAASNPHASLETLTRLVGVSKHDRQLRGALFENENLPATMRQNIGERLLLENKLTELWKRYLPQLPTIRLEFVQELLKDTGPSNWQIVFVARVSNTPADVLKQVVDEIEKVPVNRRTEVLKAVASNPGTPQETLTRLARHDDHRIRIQVARNKNTPATVLADLFKDTHPTVSAPTTRRLLEETVETGEEAGEEFVMEFPDPASLDSDADSASQSLHC